MSVKLDVGEVGSQGKNCHSIRDEHEWQPYSRYRVIAFKCLLVTFVIFGLLVFVNSKTNNDTGELSKRLVLLERRISELEHKCKEDIGDDSFSPSVQIPQDETNEYTDLSQDYRDDSDKVSDDNELYYSKEEDTDSPTEVASSFPMGLIRSKRSLPEDNNEKPGRRKKKQRKGKNAKSKVSRKRHSHQCSNSLDSLHFEAQVQLDDKMQRDFDTHGEVQVASADGKLTKQGFEPNSDQYKFWNRVIQGKGAHPDFIHISQDGDHYTIKENGIYFIYAQVLYHDMSGRWAFGIFVNDDLYTQCTTSQFIHEDYIDSLKPSERSSHGVYMHCYTAAAVHVQQNQRVSIRSLYEGRTVVSLGKSTYWGIVKLSSVDSSPKTVERNKNTLKRTL